MKKKTAFSLAELSIVILIVGLLIAGLVQGQLMVRKSKLAAAQTLTQNSPVNKIENLLLWYETSMESSFEKSERFEGGAISVWHDNNPNAITRDDATQNSSGSRPKFYENVFNGIPAVRFDGANDFLSFDGKSLISSAYTIFAVEQKQNDGGINYFIGGGNASPPVQGNLFVGYDGDDVLQGHYGSDLLYAGAGIFTKVTPRMHSFWFNTSYGKKYWLNGGENPDAEEPAQTGALIEYNSPEVGGYSSGGSGQYFNGDLAEIIIFTRSLRTEERRAVEDYLSKKYNIDLEG